MEFLALSNGSAQFPHTAAASATLRRKARAKTSKSEHPLDIVRRARERGVRFSHVGVDAGYGKEPAFVRALDDAGETFVADVHRDQRVWTEDPGLHVPAPRTPPPAA